MHYEVYWGAYKLGAKRVKDAKRLLNRLKILPVNEEIEEKTGAEMAYLEKIGLTMGIS